MKTGSRRIFTVLACCASWLGGVVFAAEPSTDNLASATVTAPQPRLVDLGAGRCIPCKMMVPVLEDLKKEYAGRMQVEFIDVWQNPDAGKKYGIRVIPTQVFYDASGKELFRHEGFISKEDILKKWAQLGVTFAEKKTAP